MDMQGYSLRRMGRCPYGAKAIVRLLATLSLAGLGSPLLAQDYELVPAVPAGAIPVSPSTLPVPTTTAQQYVVVVNGTSDQLLNQVRLIEPTAFRTTFQGRSVIQAGRFNLAPNAQQRVADLAVQGVMAETTTAAAAQPSYAQLPANVYASTGELPPLPAVGTTTASTTLPAQPPPTQAAPPSQVEFGQQLGYASPASPSTYPVNMPPPNTTAVAPTATAASSAPYYVVIPTSQANLTQLSAQVVQLGTPADRVQQRTSPRGPHVAIGPFADRDLANRWNNFYRDAGISNSRIHFQP
jgi:hypothetical protein